MNVPYKRLFLSSLKPHPQNVAIFGDPRQSEQYQDIKKSIETHGVLERIVVDQDGHVVIGCLRFACLLELHGHNPRYAIEVEVRQFGSLNEVITRMVEANVRRRTWTPEQQAMAFRALKATLPHDGGTLQQRGRPKKGSASGTFSAPALKTDEEAAKRLQIGKHKARALELIYCTPGVSQDVKDRVNAHELSPTAAAKLIKTGGGKQGSATVVKPLRQARAPAKNGGFEIDAALQRRIEKAAKLIAKKSVGQEDAATVARTVHELMLAMLNALIDTVKAAGHPEVAPRLQRTKRGWLLRDVA